MQPELLSPAARELHEASLELAKATNAVAIATKPETRRFNAALARYNEAYTPEAERELVHMRYADHRPSAQNVQHGTMEVIPPTQE